jgi:hypothetical protein
MRWTITSERQETSMGISIVAAAAVFFVVAGTLLYLIIIDNGLVRLRNDGNRAWANIDSIAQTATR